MAEQNLTFSPLPTHHKVVDLTGQIFGKLTVLGFFGIRRHANGCTEGRWWCRCQCGNIHQTPTGYLKSGNTTSCGCHKRSLLGIRSTKHGHNKGGKRTPELEAWNNMLKRCASNETNYGGRGITVCDRWQSFENFLADMGPRPSENHSVDRFPDNDGPYSPENCRWATRTEQAVNRRNTRWVEMDGEVLCMTHAANRIGISPTRLLGHLNSGRSIEDVKKLTLSRKRQSIKSKRGRIDLPEYVCWQKIIDRCYNQNSRSYKDYGMRGIRMCRRWRNSFDNFLADMGTKPSAKHSIDRIRKNGNYEPDNCRWATATEQNRNQRRNHVLTFRGQSLCVSEWSERTGIKIGCIRARIMVLGWSIAKTLTTAPCR